MGRGRIPSRVSKGQSQGEGVDTDFTYTAHINGNTRDTARTLVTVLEIVERRREFRV